MCRAATAKDPNQCIGSQGGNRQARVPDPHSCGVSLRSWCLDTHIKAVRKSTQTTAGTLAPQPSVCCESELQIFPSGRDITFPISQDIRVLWACGGQGEQIQTRGDQ